MVKHLDSTQNAPQLRKWGEQTAQTCAMVLIKSVDVTCRPGRLGISLVIEVLVPLYR